MAKKSRAIRTRNNNTMTESMFFGWLRSRLRRLSIYWKPVSVVKNEAKVPYKGDNKRRKFSYVCNECKGEFSDKEVAVHHIIPAGSLKSFDDLPGFVERLFVEKEGLRLLCNNCHAKEHERE